jgi:hypothetical protein
MKTSLNSPTKYEQERIDALRKLGCSACAMLGVPNLNQLELNHLLDGGVRMGHWFTIFLCRGHHQGDWTEGQHEWIAPHQRVAISDGRKRFALVYGTERSLWEHAQTKLKLPKVWPVSKRVPREGVRHGLDQKPARCVESLPGEAIAIALLDEGSELGHSKGER